MTGRLRTSSAGLELIKSFEGFRPAASPAPGGRWTIGYGHMRTAREGLRINEKDAEELLKHDLRPIEDVISASVFAPLTQNQFDALASLVFNISPTQFNTSDILQCLNSGDVLGAAAGFDMWRRARLNGRVIVVDALVRRRAAEKALFLDHPSGRVLAPSPVLKPEKDQESPVSDASPGGAGMESLSQTQVQPASSVDIAEAVRRLAERTREAITPAPEIPLPPGVLAAPPISAQPPAERQPAKVSEVNIETVAPPHSPATGRNDAVTAGQMAERVRGILRRPGPSIAAQRPAQAASRNDVWPDEHGSEPRIRETDNENQRIRDGLPDFDAPPEPALTAHSSVKRPFIDDTETFDPGQRPEVLFAAAERQAQKIKARTRRLGPLSGTIILQTPWIILLALSALGFVFVLASLFGAAPGASMSPQLAGAGLAVFGLMLVMSLYFIVFGGDTRDEA